MGRRKIEIKAIKDDRNRSVTFLKRKGGLFKKAHELSVLCSVDVAVFIFGSNKKLYEYSSSNMPELINRYTFHGGPNEHKGPSDFNGGADDDEEDDENGTPPQGDVMDAHMMPPHFQAQPPFQHIRHHTPSASPPIQNGVFAPHPAIARGHTPQPQMGSRPSSRNDIRRMGPGMMPQPTGPPPTPPVNGYAFMPQPAIYNPQNAPPMPQNMSHGMPSQSHPQFPYPPPQPHAHPMQPYMEDQRRSSLPPSYPPQGPQGSQVPTGPHGAPAPRHSVSPPQPPAQQLPPQPMPNMSPPPPQIHHPMQSPPQPQQHSPLHLQEPQTSGPAPVEPKAEPGEGPRQPLLLNTAAAIKKLPQRKQGGSIFTPIDENNSIFSHHQAVFHGEPKPDANGNRSQSLDVGKSSATGSPPVLQRSGTMQGDDKRNGSMASIPETTFTPPSRSNSLRSSTAGPIPGGVRPRLKVQIPDEASDGGSVTAESGSPRVSTDATSHPSRRPTDSHSSGVVLPPPSPSASALLSAGASGPPNPFARPLPHQNNNGNADTPGSALPSRFVNSDFLPSPNSFYPEWTFRSTDSNTLPSPLNFATPVVGSGPSFLREEATPHKRKSPEISGNGHALDGVDHGNEPKRVRVDS